MFGSSFHQGAMQGLGLIELIGGDVGDGCLAAILTVGVLLHHQNVDDAVEAGAGLYRELHRNDFRTINFLQLLEYHVEVALLVIQLIEQEDNGLAQFVGIAEVILRSHLHAMLSVQYDHGRIGHVESRHGSAHEVIRARAIDKVELFSVVFGVEYGSKYRISVFLFYREVVTNCIFHGNAASSLYQAAFKKDGFGQGRFT